MLLRASVIVILLAAMCMAADPLSIPEDSLPKVLSLTVPLGLDPRPKDQEGTITSERVALGRQLFFDPILSADQTVACATCHRPDHGFSSPEAKPRGIRGLQGSRRAPTLWNRTYAKALFWDGRATTLEEQALEPIANPVEMGSTVEEALRRLQADDGYRRRFAAAFSDGVTAKNLAAAIASFERMLVRGDSPVDQFRFGGRHDAMTPAERHGFWLYESKANCWRCHSGNNFTDERFHNTGVSWTKQPADRGRSQVTQAPADQGQFKTPTLRGVGLRPPYMHDGSIATLEEVVEFYNRGGDANPHLSPFIKPLNLSDGDKAALVAFLKSL
jgi:cytochrome c peroxidase